MRQRKKLCLICNYFLFIQIILNKFVMHLIKGLDMLKKKYIFILILLFIINLPLFLVIFILSIIPENKLLNIIIYTAIFYFSYFIIF